MDSMSIERQLFESRKYIPTPLTFIPFGDRVLVGTGSGSRREYLGAFLPEELPAFILSRPMGAPAPPPTYLEIEPHGADIASTEGLNLGVSL